jgi:hypothetical protein
MVGLMDIDSVRTQGLGSNFGVLDPHDGYRGNGQLWFGTCDRCGESVTNSRLDGTWMHAVVVERGNPPALGGQGDTTRQTDYCPQGSL